MSQVSGENEPMAPSFTQKLVKWREAMEAGQVRLDCILVGFPKPEVAWFHDDEPVKESDDIQLLFEGDRCTLSIQEVYIDDAGVYRCEARNQYGNEQTVSTLHVKPLSESDDDLEDVATSPKLTQVMSDLNVQSGRRVCHQCWVTGLPMQDVQKRFNNENKTRMLGNYTIEIFGDVHNVTIQEAFIEDTGTYTIKAVNMVQESKSYVETTPEPMETFEVMKMRQMIQTKESKETKLDKKELEQSPPEFQRLFHEMTVNAGEPVNIECSISGSPKPKVTWYFNGMPIVSRYYIIRMEGTRHTLHIPKTFEEDSGIFSITAENPLGKVTCLANLSVEEESPKPKARVFESSEKIHKMKKEMQDLRLTVDKLQMENEMLNATVDEKVCENLRLDTELQTFTKERMTAERTVTILQTKTEELRKELLDKYLLIDQAHNTLSRSKSLFGVTHSEEEIKIRSSLIKRMSRETNEEQQQIFKDHTETLYDITGKSKSLKSLIQNFNNDDRLPQGEPGVSDSPDDLTEIEMTAQELLKKLSKVSKTTTTVQNNYNIITSNATFQTDCLVEALTGTANSDRSINDS